MSLHIKPLFVIWEATISKSNVSIENKRIPIRKKGTKHSREETNRHNSKIVKLIIRDICDRIKQYNSALLEFRPCAFSKWRFHLSIPKCYHGR